MSHDSLVTKPASGHWTDAYPELGRGPVSLEDCVSRGVLREGTRARLQEDLALRGPRRAGAEVGQLLHPRAEVPQHLDHHRAGQGRRDPRPPQHLPAPRQQDAVGGRPLPGGAGPRAVAVLPLPRLALQAGRLAALGHPQGSAAGLRRRQLPGACDPMRGVGRLHLHQPQPATTPSRCARYLGELAHGIEGYPFAGPHQVYRVQGRIAVQLEDLPRRLRGELPRALSARLLVRRPHRGGQGGVRPAEPVHRRIGATSSTVRIGCSRSPASRRRRRRTPSPSSA